MGSEGERGWEWKEGISSACESYGLYTTCEEAIYQVTQPPYELYDACRRLTYPRLTEHAQHYQTNTIREP